jgi:carbon-monoxide dehydrogenase medium subunit/2-furoyl-CoA dehydrogenase FAD binding subunit
LIAGGQSLVPVLNMRLARPSCLIDLGGLGELNYIKEEDGGIAIGGLTRHRQVERSPLIRQRCPLLSEAVASVAHPQIRNRGTLGGSIAHADPAAELAGVLTCLDGRITLTGPAAPGWSARRSSSSPTSPPPSNRRRS